MAYKDIIKKLKISDKQKLTPVFSDLVGETSDRGKLAEFIALNERLLTEHRLSNNYSKFSKEIETLRDFRRLYNHEVAINNSWLTMMGLLEIKMLQTHCLLSPKIAYSVQEQKSGDKKFKYILLRTPFYTVLGGKKELRLYFNKLEDYPKFKTINDLKKDNQFLLDSEDAVREFIKKEMENDEVTIEQFRNNFAEAERERSRLLLDRKTHEDKKELKNK